MAMNPAQMEAALRLIGGDCENFTQGLCSDEGQGRSPYATYTAGRWCDPCIARAGLAATLPDPESDAGREKTRTCPRCGSLNWVSVSLDQGYTRRAQCVPCGHIHSGILGPGWKAGG